MPTKHVWITCWYVAPAFWCPNKPYEPEKKIEITPLQSSDHVDLPQCTPTGRWENALQHWVFRGTSQRLGNGSALSSRASQTVSWLARAAASYPCCRSDCSTSPYFSEDAEADEVDAGEKVVRGGGAAGRGSRRTWLGCERSRQGRSGEDELTGSTFYPTAQQTSEGRSCGRRGGATEQKGRRDGAGEDGREDVQVRRGRRRRVLVMSLWPRWTSCCSPPAPSPWVACFLLLRCRHLSLCGVVLRNFAKKAVSVLAREKGAGPRWRCEGGTTQFGYAVGQRRRRACSTLTCPPQPVLSRLPRLRVLVQRKSMELPTRIVVGFYKKGGSSARISIRSILDEASNVDTEFAAGRSAEFAGGRRSVEFAKGRRTVVELSNVACVGYSRDTHVVWLVC
ncbi:uncharacterized protein LOC119357869 [Triticum dicoccoides]|uniref:uncharacterized protein LOC119357869 n=1 Tax=Triticum dicoccoides TaxID=85692 RepID=UPI0018908902|nr:uncharacterized protein LOC119357869 [Triticum dicoccoides]